VRGQKLPKTKIWGLAVIKNAVYKKARKSQRKRKKENLNNVDKSRKKKRKSIESKSQLGENSLAKDSFFDHVVTGNDKGSSTQSHDLSEEKAEKVDESDMDSSSENEPSVPQEKIIIDITREKESEKKQTLEKVKSPLGDSFFDVFDKVTLDITSDGECDKVESEKSLNNSFETNVSDGNESTPPFVNAFTNVSLWSNQKSEMMDKNVTRSNDWFEQERKRITGDGVRFRLPKKVTYGESVVGKSNATTESICKVKESIAQSDSRNDSFLDVFDRLSSSTSVTNTCSRKLVDNTLSPRTEEQEKIKASKSAEEVQQTIDTSVLRESKKEVTSPYRRESSRIGQSRFSKPSTVNYFDIMSSIKAQSMQDKDMTNGNETIKTSPFFSTISPSHKNTSDSLTTQAVKQTLKISPSPSFRVMPVGPPNMDDILNAIPSVPKTTQSRKIVDRKNEQEYPLKTLNSGKIDVSKRDINKEEFTKDVTQTEDLIKKDHISNERVLFSKSSNRDDQAINDISPKVTFFDSAPISLFPSNDKEKGLKDETDRRSIMSEENFQKRVTSPTDDISADLVSQPKLHNNVNLKEKPEVSSNISPSTKKTNEELRSSQGEKDLIASDIKIKNVTISEKQMHFATGIEKRPEKFSDQSNVIQSQKEISLKPSPSTTFQGVDPTKTVEQSNSTSINFHQGVFNEQSAVVPISKSKIVEEVLVAKSESKSSTSERLVPQQSAPNRIPEKHQASPVMVREKKLHPNCYSANNRSPVSFRV